MKEPYHTALHEPEADGPAVYQWRQGRSQAFVHDVNLGIPLGMQTVSIIYSELPWKDGYLEFIRRAGQAPGIAMPYEKWLYRLSVSLTRFNIPFVLVGAKAMTRCMASEWQMPLDLNGSLAMAIGAGTPRPLGRVESAEALLRKLAGKYSVLGDFCAGYGRTARVAAEFGRDFIVSDCNPRCIGRIAEDAPRWMGLR